MTAPMEIPRRLVGRVAMVTGAAQGIGRGIAERLLAEGASVFAVDVAETELGRTIDELGPRGPIAGFATDIARRDDVRAAVSACVEMFGSLNILAANAATADVVNLMEIEEDAWRNMIGVNLTGTFFSIQEAARVMIAAGGGTIVATASTNAFWVEANTAHYSAAKAGVVALVRTAALDLAPHNIRVNAVSPGIVRTRLTKFLIDDPVQGADYLRRIPIGRYAEPSDIAAAVAFLVSDDAAYVTGENLVVDGGVTVGVPLAPPEEPLPGAVR